MSGMDRRDWIKSAAALAAAPAGAVLAAGCSSETPAATPDKSRSSSGPESVTTPDNAIVATTAGKIRGFVENGVFVFKGIPYGDTTAGENRFMPPKPVKPWTDVRPTLAWGPVSPQGPRAGWINQEEQFCYHWDDGFPGEDMLRLNVWTPAVNDGKKRPVLVWIHGGGYASGSSQELRPYDGERLAREHDVVLVSMNHRLNVFGFLDLSQIGGEKYAQSGNVEHARPRAGAPVGARQHRGLRRRCRKRDDLRPVGRRRQSDDAHGDAGGEGPLPQGRRDERIVHRREQSRVGESARARRDEGARARAVATWRNCTRSARTRW